MRSKLIAIAALSSIVGLAQAQLVVVANPAAGPLTKEQVADLYIGKAQGFTLFDQHETTASYADFYKKLTGKEVANVKSIWSRMVFTGKGQAPKQLPDTASVKKAVAAEPKGVGYIDKASVDGTVKVVLTLD